jgi:hypothetical protein
MRMFGQPVAALPAAAAMKRATIGGNVVLTASLACAAASGQ